MSEELKNEKTRAEIQKIQNSDKRETANLLLKIALGVVTITAAVIKMRED